MDKNNILGLLEEGHDTIVADLKKGDVKANLFMGIKLGDTELTDSQVGSAVAAAHLFTEQRIEFNKQYASGPARIILHKKLAYELMKKLDIIRIYYANNENGNTHLSRTGFRILEKEAEKQNPKPRPFKWAERIGTTILFLASITGVCFALYSQQPGLPGALWVLGIIMAFMVGAIPVTIYLSILDSVHDKKVNKAYRKLLSDYIQNDPNYVVKTLFSEGRDLSPRKDGTVPIQVSFPTPPEYIVPHMHEALHHINSIKGAKRMMCAHISAIGVRLTQDTFEALKPKRNDPFIAAEVGDMVIIYKNTLYGDIPNEQKYMEEISRLFSSPEKYSMLS